MHAPLHKLALVAARVRVHLVEGVIMADNVRRSGYLPVKLWHDFVGSAEGEVFRLLDLVVLVLRRGRSLLSADTGLEVLVTSEEIIVALCMPFEVHRM